MIVLVDGLPAHAVGLSEVERAVLYGDGVFETFVVVDGAVRGLSRHRERLRASAAKLGLAFDSYAIRQDLERAYGMTGLSRAYVRVTLVRRGGAGLVGASTEAVRWVHAGTPPAGPTVALRCELRPLSTLAVARGAKVASYADAACALREAHARGVHDVLGHDSEGHVLEATTSNVFMVAGGVVHTPSTAFPILPGVTRALVLEVAASLGIPVRERAIRVHELYGADEVFLTSGVRGLAAVGAIDRHVLPPVRSISDAIALGLEALPRERLSVVDEGPGSG